MSAFKGIGLSLVLLAGAPLEEALEFFQKAAQRRPTDADTFYNLGILCYKMGKLEKAVEYFRKSIELNPRNSKAYFNLGIVFYKKGLKSEARLMFEKTSALDPGGKTGELARKNLQALKER